MFFALLSLVCGCKSTCRAVSDFVLDDNHLITCEEHGWHSVPAKVAAFATVLVLAIPAQVLAAAEALVTWDGSRADLKECDSATKACVSVIAGGVGSLIALPFYIGGLPWESSCRPEPPPASKASTDPDR